MTTTARRRSAYAAAAALAVVLAILTVWLLRPDSAEKPAAEVQPPAPQTITPGVVFKSNTCGNPATSPFVPTRITLAGVTTKARVHALPRDAYDVPSAVPLNNPGAKTDVAWDAPTTKPGSQHGNVLLNAHTWPDGTALGNKLMATFAVGDRIILYGGQGQELCYQVTKKEVIVADDGSWDYYGKTWTPSQIALIVCSPPRLGPGIWKHRTIWYASPVAPDDSAAF